MEGLIGMSPTLLTYEEEQGIGIVLVDSKDVKDNSSYNENYIYFDWYVGNDRYQLTFRRFGMISKLIPSMIGCMDSITRDDEFDRYLWDIPVSELTIPELGFQVGVCFKLTHRPIRINKVGDIIYNTSSPFGITMWCDPIVADRDFKNIPYGVFFTKSDLHFLLWLVS